MPDLKQLLEYIRFRGTNPEQASSMAWWSLGWKRELDTINTNLNKGPEPPGEDKIRVLNASLLQTLLANVLGDKYTKCPAKHFSDTDYLVCPKEDVERWLEFFGKFWLPKIKPYRIVKWKKLDGTEVEIYAVDCDDFSDAFQGITAVYEKWAPFPWGEFWGLIEGPSMMGGHAFCWVVTCDESFDEKSVDGLKLHIIEPQWSESWVAGTEMMSHQKFVRVDELRLAEMSPAYEIKELWMVKV